MATVQLSDLGQAAVEYACRGWYVIPLHDVTAGYCSCGKGKDCKDAGKHPRLEAWQEQATIDEATIRKWWGQWPNANIGILTGVQSDIAVIDIDPRNGGDESLRELEQMYGELPETPTVLSGGGGVHYYFRLTEDLPSPKLAPGVDFLAGGNKQVVAPPSLHPSGKRYEWEGKLRGKGAGRAARASRHRRDRREHLPRPEREDALGATLWRPGGRAIAGRRRAHGTGSDAALPACVLLAAG